MKLKRSYLFFIVYLWVSSLQAETIRGNIDYFISGLSIKGTIDVQLRTNAVKNTFEINYSGEPHSKINLTHKNSVLYVQTEGVFHGRPVLVINFSQSIDEYNATGIGDSNLYIENGKSLSIGLSGVNKVKIIGSSDDLRFELAGTSSLNLVDFISEKEIVGSLKGVSSVYVRKNTLLNVIIAL